MEELFLRESYGKLWILGDSGTRINYLEETVYDSFIDSKITLKIMNYLESMSSNQTTIVCTDSGAYIESTASDE